MRLSFVFVALIAFSVMGDRAPIFAQTSAQSALVPVVSAETTTADANRTLSLIEARAFFVGKIGERRITPEEIVYVIARPVSRSEARSHSGEAASYFYDTATKELTIYGGFFQRAANRNETENTLFLDQTKTFGKRRDEKDSFGNTVTVTPETNTTYTLHLNGLLDFDARLYQRNTQRIAVRFQNVDALDARKISRSVQIVLGVRRVGNAQATALLGPASLPRNPQLEANMQVTSTLNAALTDIFVIDAATKKVLFHYVPKPKPLR